MCGMQTLSIPSESAPAPSKGSEKAVGDTDKQQIDVTQSLKIHYIHTQFPQAGISVHVRILLPLRKDGCCMDHSHSGFLQGVLGIGVSNTWESVGSSNKLQG